MIKTFKIFIIIALFQVEPGAMLFPAVFFEPTNKEVLQLELGRTKVSKSQYFLVLSTTSPISCLITAV